MLKLFFDLQNDTEFKEVMPCETLEYKPLSGEYALPYIFMDWDYNENNFSIRVSYTSNFNGEFLIKFFDKTSKDISPKIINQLTTHGFENKETTYEMIINESEVRDKLFDLCISLN